MNRMTKRIMYVCAASVFDGLKPLDDLLEPADHRRACKRTPYVADAAHDDRHEGLYDVLLSDLRRHLSEQTDRNACDACDTGAKTECKHVDAFGVYSHRRRHSGVLCDRAHFEAETRPVHDQQKDREKNQREHEDRDPDVADRNDVVDDERAVEPVRRRQGACLSAERCSSLTAGAQWRSRMSQGASREGDDRANG